MKTMEEHAALIFKLPNALEIIRTSGIDELHRQMQAANVERKQNDTAEEPETEEPKQLNEDAVNAVFSEVVEAQAYQAVTMDEIKALLETQQKAKDTEIADLTKQLDALNKTVVKLQSDLELSPKRASESTRTQPNADAQTKLSTVKTDADANQYDPFFEGMKVPAQGGA